MAAFLQFVYGNKHAVYDQDAVTLQVGKAYTCSLIRLLVVNLLIVNLTISNEIIPYSRSFQELNEISSRLGRRAGSIEILDRECRCDLGFDEMYIRFWCG